MLKYLITLIGNSFITGQKPSVEIFHPEEEKIIPYVNTITSDPTINMLTDMIREDLTKNISHKKYQRLCGDRRFESMQERRSRQLVEARQKYHKKNKDSEEYKEKQKDRSKQYYQANSETIKQKRKLRYLFSKLDK